MEETTIDRPELEKSSRRPVFLTVLCILTWIGSAGLIWFFVSLFLSIRQNYLFTIDPLLIWTLLINITCSVISMAGSIVVWTRRKWGFYLYAIGQAIPSLLMIYVLVSGSVSLERATSLAIAAVTLWIVVPIGFVLLYGLQLKHLRR